MPKSPDSNDLFSPKKFFLNNLDSYHGEHFIKQITKILDARKAADDALLPPIIEPLGEDEVQPPPPPEPYELIGTVFDEKIEEIEGVTRVIPGSCSKLTQQMLCCGTVIIDISCDHNQVQMALDYLKLLKDLLEKEEVALPSVQEAAGDTSSPNTVKRTLILISSIMTWASTKPLDPETPDLAFVETDFRKRKPHPNYKEHFNVENLVIEIARKYKRLIGSIVVAAGLVYGGKEDILYYWFQKAWENEPILPISGRGNNIVPMINIVNLVQVLYNLLNDFPKKLYILAVEPNQTLQKEIIKSIGRSLGSGLFKCIPQEDSFLIKQLTERVIDYMNVNLVMEPTFITETMGLQLTEASFAENTPVLIKEFKKERGLKSFKIFVHGPPIVGKTTLSKKLCTAYGLVYVSPETVVQDILDDLRFKVKHWDEGETKGLSMLPEYEDEDEEEVSGEEEALQDSTRQTLALLESGRPISDEEIYGFIRQRMLSKEAENKGWVLDGFPTNLKLCETLFEKGDTADADVEDEDNEDVFEEDQNLYDNILKKMLPDVVVSLQTTDNFLYNKAMRQPEGDPRLEEEAVFKRVVAFRLEDSPDVTVLNFFDELSLHPLVINVNDDRDYAMEKPYKHVSLRLGGPCRYPKLIASIEAAEAKIKAEEEDLKKYDEKVKQELEATLKKEKEDKMEYWSELYAAMREEEEAALAAAGEPMRNYLMNHIFPTLTPALLEVAKMRPKDPVDFLAEYLFKLNPTGKMLEPGYNLQAEKLMGKIKLLDDTLKDLDIKIEMLLPTAVDFASTDESNESLM